MINEVTKKLPWWTWVAPLILIEICDQASLFFQYSVTSSLYLPTAASLILVHWWGPARVLPSVFLIGSLNNAFYGIENYWVWPLFGVVDIIGIYTSWFLFQKFFNGHYDLPDTRTTAAFGIFGLAIPIVIIVLGWQVLYILDGKLAVANFFWQFNNDLVAELMAQSLFTIPMLYYVSPILAKKNLLLSDEIRPRAYRKLSKRSIRVLSSLLLITLVASINLEFEDFWFLFGFISLFIAIQFGFGLVILSNVVIILLTYLPPALDNQLFSMTNFQNDERALRVFFGYFLLYVFSTMTGRVISDLRNTKQQLHMQNKELKQTNAELDRFVYSVSHDLTAPLKSILGLVNVSRMANPNSEVISYLNKIQVSVLKLEGFIKDILHYSRNKRTVVIKEPIDLYEMCSQIVESIRFHHTHQQVTVDLSGLEGKSITSDRGRLFVILNNLITNAIKYQRKNDSHHPQVWVYTENTDSTYTLVVQDNGAGISPEVLPDIFKMFFRGSLDSQGSGLGLYIAKETCERIGGKITVDSVYGEGSKFKVILRQ
jgi:signal transduction histidine kinase